MSAKKKAARPRLYYVVTLPFGGYRVGDDKGRPFRSLTAAEGCAGYLEEAIGCNAYVEPIKSAADCVKSIKEQIRGKIRGRRK